VAGGGRWLPGEAVYWFYIALLALVSLAVSAVSGRPSSVVSQGSATFRVATFNIHKGADRRGAYKLQRTIEAIVRLDANLVAVQEAVRNNKGFGCDDQPALIAEGLRRRTGRPWTHVYAGARTAESEECAARGSDRVPTEGIAFFAPEPIIASKYVYLSERRLGLVAHIASMPEVPIVVTHLAASNSSQLSRVQEIAVLLPWAERHGPGMLVGDFNATPEASELSPVTARYVDAWAQAAARGIAAGVESGATWAGRRGRRIDYVFYAGALDLTLVSAEVVDTSILSGLGDVSDHRPLVATFRRLMPRSLRVAEAPEHRKFVSNPPLLEAGLQGAPAE